MARKSQAAAQADASAGGDDTPTRVKFVRMWCSVHGVFIVGQKAELPAEIAESLADEGIVELEE
jgi:hypothetical protein